MKTLKTECDICGQHIGMGYNHTKCSRIKQKRAKKRKKVSKKLSTKQIESLVDYCNYLDTQ